MEVIYSEAELICDNLSTHKVASLFESFPPEQAIELAKRLEIHYTPEARQLAEYC